MTPTATAPVRPVAAPEPIESPPVAKPKHPWWVVGLNSVPNLVVFSILGGVMYVGHHTDWKLPRMSSLIGTATAPVDDWCAEHLVPESSCIECRTELFPKRKLTGFCREHGVAECVMST